MPLPEGSALAGRAEFRHFGHAGKAGRMTWRSPELPNSEFAVIPDAAHYSWRTAPRSTCNTSSIGPTRSNQDAEAPPAGVRPIVETACVARSRRIASTPARVSDARDARWGSRRPHRAQRIGWASSRPRTPGSGRVSGRASGMRPARGPSSSAGQGAHAHEGEMSSWRSSSSSPRERPARCSQNAMAAHAEAQGEARPSQDGPEWALALHPSATSQLAGSDGMLAPRCAEGRRPTASLIDLGLGDQHRGRDGAAAGGAAGGVR